MTQLSRETRIIIACAVSLAAIDIYVRFATAPKSVTSSVITAQEFRLSDKNGNIRAVMNTDANGEPGLVMFDRSGTPRLQLDSYETTPSLILMDENGAQRAYYGMSSPTGDGELTFSNANGSDTASLKISGGASQFSLMDGNGDSRAQWRTSTEGVSGTMSCEAMTIRGN
ncbi:MAG: hypothetical protein H7Y38_17360 [Armatimonadetes bacterium]|nr:hypothetical protein [Armatimonadota bacterium]